MNEQIDPALVQQILGDVGGKPLEMVTDCGCEFGTVGDVFLVRPCSRRCERYQYVMAQGRKQGKPFTYGYENGN